MISIRRLLLTGLAILSSLPLATFAQESVHVIRRRFVSPITPEVKSHLRAIKLRGDALGRAPGILGQWGDSITHSAAYLGGIGCWAMITVPPADNHNYTPTLLWMGASPGSDSSPLYRFKGGGYCNESGWRVPNALNVVDDAIARANPSWSLTMYGTNDIRQSGWNAATYDAQLERLIQINIDAGIVPILSTIPPCTGYDARVAEANTVIRQVATRLRIPLVDLHGVFLALHPTDWATVLLGDGVHPSHSYATGDLSEASLRDDGYNIRTMLTVDMAEKLRAIVFDNSAPDGANLPLLVVTSSTHPYKTLTNGLSPTFTFAHDSGPTPTAYSWSIDQSPWTEPDTIVETTSASVTAPLSSAGTWYFHVRANSAAGWGPAAHYCLRATDAPTVELRHGSNTASLHRDTFISALWGGNGNFGGAATLNIYNEGSSPSSRGLFFFDLSGISPTGLESATLILNIDTPQTSATTWDLFPVTSTWTEGIGDGYNNNNTGVTWATAPTFGATALATGSLAGGATTIEINITAAAQGWLNAPATNFGVMFQHRSLWRSLYLITREYADVSLRPTLRLRYASSVDLIPPSAPRNFSAALVGSNSAALAWTAATDNSGVTGYRIYRNGTLLASTPGLTHTDTNLPVASTFTYTVTAVDAAGNEGPAASAPAVTTPAPTLYVGPDRTITVRGGTSLEATFSGLTLSTPLAWSQISGPSGVRIVNPTNPHTAVYFTTGGTYTFRCTVTSGSATYTDDVVITVDGTALTRRTVNVATVAQLRTALTNAVTGDIILLADGIYNLAATPNTSGGTWCTLAGVNDITIRSASDNAAAVTLRGNGFADRSSNADGLWLWSCARVTVRSLSFSGFGAYAIKLEANTTPVAEDIRIENCNFLETGMRCIKGTITPTGNYVQRGWVKNCRFENTALPPDTSYSGDYIAAIDMMALCNWEFADNNFINVLGRTGGGRAAVFLWHQTRGALIERNFISGCDRGIAFGNPSGNADIHASWSIARNNLIVMGRADGITPDEPLELAQVEHVRIAHNTAWRATASARGVRCSGFVTDGEIANNIVRGQPTLVTGANAHHNLFGDVSSALFVNAAGNNFHLVGTAATAIGQGALLASVTTDFDLSARDAAPDLGAFEYAASADTQPPSTPTSLTATASSSSAITLTWSASTDNIGIAGYRIYRATASAALTLIGSSTTPTFADSGLSAATTYRYTVAAYDAAGNTSAQSAEVSATTQALGSRNAFTQTEAETFDSVTGEIHSEPCSEGGLNIGWITSGSRAVFNRVDFGTGAASFSARVASANNGGQIELRLDSPTGPVIGTATVSRTGNWQLWETVQCNISGASGLHDLYLLFSGPVDYVFNINWFAFSTAPSTTVVAPTFSPAAGTYTVAQSVSLATTTTGASIRYTTDGSTPTPTAGTLYSTPINIASTTTLRAIAYRTGFTDSPVATATYTISPPDTQPPSTPTGLTAPAFTHSTVSLTWNAATDNVAVASYRILRQGTVVGTVAAPTTAFVDTNCTPSTSYSYTVIAVDTANNSSPASAAHTVTTASAPPLGALYTHSFSNRAGWGTRPQSISYSGGVMTVDLSSIQGANIVRAVFYPHLDRHGLPWPSLDRNAMAGGFNIFDAANNPIPLRGPRFTSVDLTAQVRAAIATGSLSLRLQHPGSAQFPLTLSVTCDRPLPAPMPAVTGVSATFQQGDTMITFAEIEPPLTDPNTTWRTFRNAFDALDTTNEIRYRIYRSTTPLVAAANIANAALVDEIPPLSCWNSLYFGITEPGDSTVVPRYPVANLTIAAPGTGIYVNRFRGAAPANAYYFVSRMVNGQEDLSTLTIGANATGAVAESTGPGMVLERARENDASHYYIDHATRHYYVRWEAPPTCNLPSTPFDYLVCEPPPTARVSPAPVSLALHCWGGSLNGGYLWWYDAMKGALHVSTNQYPYDWWTAYNENYGTLKPFATGTVQPFTQARLLSFLYDFVDPTFRIDRNKVLLHGMSMGGSGASMWGIRSGHIFSGIISMVGVHIPAESPSFASSYATVFGPQNTPCRYDNSILQRFGYPLVSASDNVSAWDYWDNDLWLRTHPTSETPWITYSNGQNDGAIGWPQAWDMTRALIDTKRGFNLVWGQGGHGQRPVQLGGFSGGNSTLEFRFDQFVPAATNCSLNGNLGTSPETAAPSGQINQYLTWDTTTVAETATSLSFRLALSNASTATSATADITPRRLQAFHPAPGTTCTWQALNSTGTLLNSGTVSVDSSGLFTLPAIPLPKLPAYTTVVITGAAPANYSTWRSANFSGADLSNDAISGPLADPDAAGLTNFQRYAHNLPARGPVPTPVTHGTTSANGQTYLTLSFDRRASAPGLTYAVEASTDLRTWAAVAGLSYTAGTPARITAQDTVPLGTTPRRFLRLRVHLPQP